MNVSGFLRKCSDRYIQLDFPAQHVRIYVCSMYVYVCMYVFMYVISMYKKYSFFINECSCPYINACKTNKICLCIYGLQYMNLCMYVCMYVCMNVYTMSVCAHACTSIILVEIQLLIICTLLFV